MCCPYCGTDESRVVDSRAADDGIRRRRECLACSARFTTYERIEAAGVLVVKRDGRREPFAREKLLAGLRRACEKRPLAAGVIDAVADAVEQQVHARNLPEAPSTVIGELVMEQLKSLDQIAYVRFASVYREFADLDSLRVVLDELDANPLRVAPVDQHALAVSGSGGHSGSASVVSLPRPRWKRGKAR